MMAHTMSMFDPATSPYLNINWLILFAPLIIPFSSYWSTPSRYNSFASLLLDTLYNHWVSITKTNVMSVTLFLLIATWNLLGLLPYVFTLLPNLSSLYPLLPFWSAPLLHGMIITPQMGSAHLTPAGLGNLILGIAMALTELISLFLRPITLTLRLVINITAGHLILGLIAGGSMITSVSIFALLGAVMFIILEMAVAVIQAYVFSMLSLLYSKEG
uniref:ATP synthase subunit a n=1 Tax=Vargula hilgendorfii TaxID=6674 RepID=Q766W9_VARHI|nr:ATP synthase F0 subunit 6 [Vargula hilgendorfii]BAD06239.1 ATPase subunit 6 [Vargula hilgendorfii]